MSQELPNHHDADIILKLYDLRREAVMRESRNAINSKFWPKSYEDFVAITKPDHPLNAAFRQVGSYWEMVYGFAFHGVVNPDFNIEMNGEGLFLYAKAKPFVERYRLEIAPTAFQRAQWITENCVEGKRRFAMIEARVKKMLETK